MSATGKDRPLTRQRFAKLAVARSCRRKRKSLRLRLIREPLMAKNILSMERLMRFLMQSLAMLLSK